MALLPRIAASPRWARVRAALARPSIVPLAAAIGVVVFAQALAFGFQADDVWHQIFIRNPPRWSLAVPSPLTLFEFYDGNPTRTRWLVDQGIANWWTDPTVRIAFLRPLTALTHFFDHAVAPGSPLFAHAHTLLWYGALCAAVAALYRRALGPTWVAGLAAVFYAVDYNHGVIASWIANRSALVSGALGVAALVAHARAGAQAEGRLRWIALSTLLLASSLLGGESGVGACAFFAAWALTMDRGPLARRLAALSPQIAVSLAWAAVYRAGHWGARGSGMYLDPLRDPLALAASMLEKVPFLVAAELGAPGPDAILLSPRWQQLALLAFAVALTAAAGVALAPILRRDRAARFFALATALSLGPACATLVSVRQLTFAGIGLVGLVAQLCARVMDPEVDPAFRLPERGARRRVTLAVALLAGLAHGPLSPLVAQGAVRQLWVVERLLHKWSDPVDDKGLEQARLVIVNAPAYPFIGYLPARRTIDGRAVPSSMLTFGLGTRAMEISRPDEKTLVVQQEGGFAATEMEQLTSSGAMRWKVGDRVSLTGVAIDVLTVTRDARPLRAAFRFEVALEDASLRWMAWDGDGLVAFELPKVGGSVRVPGRVLSPF
jgi:hypothetical protein